MVALNFNAQQYQPQYGGGGGLPAGPDGGPVRYKVVISNTEQKPTSKGDGGYLAFELTCIEGPQQGVKQSDNLNLWNPSQKAVEIANKQLSAYCHVTGKFVVNDSMELCNIPFQVEIRKQKNGDYTEVSGVFDINGNEPGKSGAGAQVAPAPAPMPPAAQVAPAQQQWAPPAQEAAQQPQASPPQAWGAPQPQAAPAPAQQPQWAPPGAVAPTAPAPGGWGAR